MDKVVEELEYRIQMLRSELAKTEGVLEQVKGLVGGEFSGSSPPREVQRDVLEARSLSLSLSAPRSEPGANERHPRAAATAMRRSFGMSIAEYLACVVASYPGQIWTAAELWEEVSSQFKARTQMYNGCLSSSRKGFMKFEGSGTYSSTKAGERLRAKKIQEGVLDAGDASAKKKRVNGAKSSDAVGSKTPVRPGDAARSSKNGESLTGLGAALLELELAEKTGNAQRGASKRSAPAPATRSPVQKGSAKAKPSEPSEPIRETETAMFRRERLAKVLDAHKVASKRSAPTSATPSPVRKGSAKAKSRESLDSIVRQLTPPTVEEAERRVDGKGEPTAPEPVAKEVVSHLKAFLAAHKDEAWRFTSLVSESGLDSRQIAGALRELTQDGEVARIEGGAYSYVGVH